MQHAPVIQAAHAAALVRIQNEYAHLIKIGARFSLQDLFSSDQVQLASFCKDYNPYPPNNEISRIVQQFGEEYGVWNANAKTNIKCAFLLYPSAHQDRLITIMKNLTVGFYLNDIMGRDVFKYLPDQQQQDARRMIHKMGQLNESLVVSSDSNQVELANLATLREFRENSPRKWFSKFLSFYCHHIEITHKDRNTDALGHIPSVSEYIENRCHLSGMNHIVMWIEYCDDRFLDWDQLRSTNIPQKLQRLYWLMAAFGGLSNDLFSFEKEAIDNVSDSNLIPIIMINNPNLSLSESIFQAALIVRNMLSEMIGLLAYFDQEIMKIKTSLPEMANDLSIHFKGILRFIQAMWLFQIYSARYKRQVSIWNETSA